MTDLQLSHHNSRHLPSPTRRSHKDTYKNIPNNEDAEPCATMEVVYEETDPDVMTNGSTASSSTVATRHLARLKEKLEKLLQAPSTNSNMEIDEEELKKRARTPNMHDGRASTPTTAIEFTKPEGKKSRNDETPPPHVKAKALFIAQKAAEKADINMTEAPMQAKDSNKKQQVVLNKEMQQETSQATFNIETTSTATQQKDEAELQGENESIETTSVNTPPATKKAEMATDDKSNAGSASTKTQEDEQSTLAKEVATMKAPTVISPKEWRYLHNNWLQSAMRAAMGDEAHPDIPNLAEYRYTPRNELDYEIEVEPTREQVI